MTIFDHTIFLKDLSWFLHKKNSTNCIKDVNKTSDAVRLLSDVYCLIDVNSPNIKTNKEIRIRGLIPLYQAGVIFHNQHNDISYEVELINFPKGKNDDRIDAMASQLEAVSHTDYDDIEIVQEKVNLDPYRWK